MAAFGNMITTIDSHTAGEPTRLITGGLPPIPGHTMAEKLAYASRNLARVLGLLMLEPRGHRDMFGAVLVPPVDPTADIGLIFLDNQSYEPMCGHGVIGAVTSLLETGALTMKEPLTTVVIDTAAGLVRAEACIEAGRVTQVTMENAPAFVYQQNVALAWPGHADLVVDIAFGGNFFVLVDARQLALDLVPAQAGHLACLGMQILELANSQIAVSHPDLPDINHIIDLRFYCEPGRDGADSRNVVVLGDHMIDRSPCGTGTCAELALRHARGQLKPQQPWIVESIIGTRFTGEIAAETTIGQGANTLPAIIPRVTGSAYITGFCQWVLHPHDPFPQGFALGL
jgi:proline racemase